MYGTWFQALESAGSDWFPQLKFVSSCDVLSDTTHTSLHSMGLLKHHKHHFTDILSRGLAVMGRSTLCMIFFPHPPCSRTKQKNNIFALAPSTISLMYQVCPKTAWLQSSLLKPLLQNHSQSVPSLPKKSVTGQEGGGVGETAELSSHAFIGVPMFYVLAGVPNARKSAHFLRTWT